MANGGGSQVVLEGIDLDQLTWNAIISGGLGKFYGLIGQSLHYSIEKLENHGFKAVIRVMKEDEKQFLNSFFTHKFKFSNYYGGSVDCECYVNHISTSIVQE